MTADHPDDVDYQQAMNRIAAELGMGIIYLNPLTSQWGELIDRLREVIADSEPEPLGNESALLVGGE